MYFWPSLETDGAISFFLVLKFRNLKSQILVKKKKKNVKKGEKN